MVESSLVDERAREHTPSAEARLRDLFAALIGESAVDARFVDASRQAVVGVAGLPFAAPVVGRLLRDPEVFACLSQLWREGGSLLARLEGEAVAVYVAKDQVEGGASREGDPHPSPLPGGEGARPPEGEGVRLPLPLGEGRGEGALLRTELPRHLADGVAAVLREVPTWAGTLDEQGRHVIDLRSPSPGPHFFTNVLLGNRLGYPRALQTTPKSVVDRLGRGSFRAHAATQVLATRWDMRPEENGFPANRQFYLVEAGRRVFYSADPQDANVAWAQAVHGQNQTAITYRTHCGLEIERTIFLLPYEEGLPLATEVQTLRVANHSQAPRHLRLVATGMFGAAAPGGLQQDVVYTTVGMQGRVLRHADGSIAAVSPHYHPTWTHEDARFYAMVVHAGERTFYPTEFGTSYNEFVGEGTLEHPEGLAALSNQLARKGPGFFALAAPLDLPPGGTARADTFTSLVSEQPDGGRGEELLRPQVEQLLGRFAAAEAVDCARAANDDFFDRYRRHLEVRSDEAQFDAFVNRNLPFQVLYQTFVSRSFDQTQKGYREIGFREIQDLFASLPSFIAMGQQGFARDLLKEWASQVFELGYAYHNFYWRGKEPGEYSDDALWLVQAAAIYLNLTGDLAFLDETCEVAGTGPAQRRTIYQTLQAILRYSGELSIGKHGLPL
ncbi:MAG: glycosyl transferase, partial [Chloroflexi bacterium]|nr:glycosyl transferase [Chloroflexota bacterium]